jgi:hypothetical protein
MQLSYKGWLISCHPKEKESNNAIEFRIWNVVLHSDTTHTFAVLQTILYRRLKD